MSRSRRTEKPRYAPCPRRGALRVSEARPADPLLPERLRLLLESFGNNRLAALLGVSASQPSRWKSGEERIGAESERRLLDLDYVMGRLLQLFPREQAGIWLLSNNAHLGARPVDVLRLRGAAPVVQAIDAEAEGAYA